MRRNSTVHLQAFLPLVPYPDPLLPRAGSNAATVAALLDMEVHALAVNVQIPSVSDAFSKFLLTTPELIRQANSRSREHGEDILRIVTDQAKLAGVKLMVDRMETPLALLGDLAAERARYFDCSLIGWEADSHGFHTLAEDIIFGSGRPAILLPGSVKPAPFDHVAIAWDGSRVAARAVADAAPLLGRTSRISVITVIDEKELREENPGARLARGLQERGLLAEMLAALNDGGDIAITLQENAIQSGAGLLVMGGYGHTRIRDFVLGGATDGVLRDLRLPILISH
jgi:nucleotide-binding universal stress UspA family protein